MAGDFRHFLTYQHNVQRYFRDHSDKYDGVIVPLSIATAFPSGTYGFVRALCHLHKDKSYAIDPRNALFQYRWNREKNVRDPHKRMVQALGGPFEAVGLSRPVTPADFADDEVIEQITTNCLEYQEKFRTRVEDEKKLNKYKKLLGLETLGRLRAPQFLIPPYFKFSSLNDDWYGISQRCIEAAVERGGSIPIEPVIHFDDWASVGNWKTVCGMLKGHGIKSFWLYPNEFREHEASLEELKRYRQAVKVASDAGLSPYSLFGGYFSIALQKFGLAGFGNGIGYGEWRDSGYHKGGSAATRVYLLKLHRFLDSPVAEHLIESNPEYFGRDTDILSECMDGGDLVSSLELAQCLDHFLECRQLELNFVAGSDAFDIASELAETIEVLEEIGEVERDKFGDSLDRWASALR